MARGGSAAIRPKGHHPPGHPLPRLFPHAAGSGDTSFFHDFPGVTLNGPATFTRGNSGSTLRFNDAITGTGGLTLVNNGIVDGLRLTIASTYTGSTTVNGTARVRFDVNGAVPTDSALTVNGSALFQAASTIGSLAGGGNVFMNGSNTLTVGGNNTSTTFSGVYQDSGGMAGLTKIGTGTLILSSANTYTGATTVDEGTLAVDGSLVSPVTVNSGGILAGTGTITDAVTVLSSGTLAPGLSTGILDTGTLTLNGGSTLTIELNGPTVDTQYDQVNVTGTVTLGGATLTVVLDFTPSVGQVFTIINNDSTDLVVGTFAGLVEGATLSVGSALFTLSYVGGDGNDVTLTPLVVTPFATFRALQLEIELRPRIDDAFELQSRFTLGACSDGIAPLTETVELALTGGTGAFTVTIPAGAFTQNKQGQFTFKGTIDGVELKAKIMPLRGIVYKFEATGNHADLSGIANPVTVVLTIGDDSGSTTVTAYIEPGD